MAMMQPTEEDSGKALAIIQQANIQPKQLLADLRQFVFEPLFANVIDQFKDLDPALVAALRQTWDAQIKQVEQSVLALPGIERQAIETGKGEQAVTNIAHIGKALVAQLERIVPHDFRQVVLDDAANRELAEEVAKQRGLPRYLQDMLRAAPTIMRSFFVAAQLSVQALLNNPLVPQAVVQNIPAGSQQQKGQHLAASTAQLAMLRTTLGSGMLGAAAMLPRSMRQRMQPEIADEAKNALKNRLSYESAKTIAQMAEGVGISPQDSAAFSNAVQVQGQRYVGAAGLFGIPQPGEEWQRLFKQQRALPGPKPVQPGPLIEKVE